MADCLRCGELQAEIDRLSAELERAIIVDDGIARRLSQAFKLSVDQGRILAALYAASHPLTPAEVDQLCPPVSPMGWHRRRDAEFRTVQVIRTQVHHIRRRVGVGVLVSGGGGKNRGWPGYELSPAGRQMLDFALCP
jgi:hypothetical protein